MNVVGGYVVTDRMLQMFRKKPTAPKATTESADGAPGASQEHVDVRGVALHLRLSSPGWSAAACFVLGLHRMN